MQYRQDGCQALPAVIQTTATPVESEPLPETPEEYAAWEKEFLTSPKEKAMRLIALSELARVGSDVAKLNALKLLDEKAAEIDDFSGVPEKVLFTIAGEDD